MSRTGQVSIEFIIIVAISLFLLTGATILVMDYLRTNQTGSDLQRVTQIGYRVIDEATNAYVYGKDSFIQVQAAVPSSVIDVYVVDNNTLVFDVSTQNGITSVPVFSSIPINGTRAVGDKVFVNDADISIGGGKGIFQVTSKGSWVEVAYIP